MAAVPVHVEFGGLNAGETPTVTTTYQCDGFDDAMRLIHEAAATHSNVDSEYKRETGVLVLTVS